MTRLMIFTSFFLLITELKAQTDNAWITYLKSRKDQFYLKDTIATYFEISKDYNFFAGYLPLNVVDCEKFFRETDDIQDCRWPNPSYYFYSYYNSKDSYSTLTFLSFGKYTPVLTLYNYSPAGNLILRLEVKSDFMDAGQADSTRTIFTDRNNFIIQHWDGYEIENGDIVDSLTYTNYIFEKTGEIRQGERTFKRGTRH